MKELYTYVFDFRGGTFVSQVEAESLDASLDEWVKKIVIQKDGIQFLGEFTIQEIKDQFKIPDNRKPTLLDGLSNVWCETILTNQGSGMLNIIKTKKDIPTNTDASIQ